MNKVEEKKITREAAEEYENNRVYEKELEKYGFYLDSLEEGEEPKMKEPSKETKFLLNADIIKAFIAGAEWQKEHSFTHHETNESLEEVVTHQMEDDGDVDDFIRKGLDETVLKYAQIGAEWQTKQFETNRLAACDRMTEEEYQRESEFADNFIKKEHRTPTFSDAISYGMELQKEQMLKNALDGVIDYETYGIIYLKQIITDKKGKVKVIVIKEDKKC